MADGLEIKRESKGDVLILTLSGNITEDSQIEEMAKDLKPKVALNLEKVRRINSYGIRQWINVMKTIREKVSQLIFFRCPPILIEQFNMISNFGGGGMVYSFQLPFHCEKCDQEHLTLYELPGGKGADAAPSLQANCPKCKSPMNFNDIEDEYFFFLQHQKSQTVDPGIIAAIRGIA